MAYNLPLNRELTNDIYESTLEYNKYHLPVSSVDKKEPMSFIMTLERLTYLLHMLKLPVIVLKLSQAMKPRCSQDIVSVLKTLDCKGILYYIKFEERVHDR